MKTTTTVRSLSEADPTYATAAETLQRLRGKLRDLDNEESRLLDQLARRPQDVGPTSRVLALLGEDVIDEADDGPRLRLKAIASERIDLRAAVNIANQRVQTARFAASRAICAEVAPAYSERVKALAGALIGAHAAHQELLALISELNSNDVAWGSLVPMQAESILGHDSGKVAGWLRQALDAGYVTPKEIPPELKI